MPYRITALGICRAKTSLFAVTAQAMIPSRCMTRVEELRKKHRRFTLEEVALSIEDSHLRLQARMILESEIIFSPELLIPLPPQIKTISPAVRALANQLAIIETLSYWKATCPAELVCKVPSLLSPSFFKTLLFEGLGEFFFRNEISPSPEFVNIIFNEQAEKPICESKDPEKVLFLIGGGKDSVVAGEILAQRPAFKEKGLILLLNPTPSALRVTAQLGFSSPIIVKRTIDKNLITLNKAGYLNGHTPFSAYLAALATLVGEIYGAGKAFVANESSANEPTIGGVNHQYSKSLHFEQLFVKHQEENIPGATRYGSLIRPFYDLQVATLFAKLTPYHSIFRSCNVGHYQDSWCGSCGKCAFVGLTLAPFLQPEQLRAIFGQDIFSNQVITTPLEELLGLLPSKPFDCVGTRQESVIALTLAQRNHAQGVFPLLDHMATKTKLSSEGEIKTFFNTFALTTLSTYDEKQVISYYKSHGYLGTP